MAKYSHEFKLEVVQCYSSGQGGYRKTAKYFNIDPATVRKWLLIYELHGEHGLLKQANKSNYSVEFKQEVVLCMINEGLSSREIVKRFKLKERQMVMNWLRQFEENGIEGLKPKPRGRPKEMPKPKRANTKHDKEDRDKTQKQLLEELAYLRAENAFLKKRRALRLKQEAAEQQRLQDSYQD